MEREQREEEETTDREQIEEQRRRSVSKTTTYGKREQKNNKITIIHRLHFEFVVHSMAHLVLFHKNHRQRQYQTFHSRSPFGW